MSGHRARPATASVYRVHRLQSRRLHCFRPSRRTDGRIERLWRGDAALARLLHAPIATSRPDSPPLGYQSADGYSSGEGFAPPSPNCPPTPILGFLTPATRPRRRPASAADRIAPIAAAKAAAAAAAATAATVAAAAATAAAAAAAAAATIAATAGPAPTAHAAMPPRPASARPLTARALLACDSPRRPASARCRRYTDTPTADAPGHVLPHPPHPPHTPHTPLRAQSQQPPHSPLPPPPPPPTPPPPPPPPPSAGCGCRAASGLNSSGGQLHASASVPSPRAGTYPEHAAPLVRHAEKGTIEKGISHRLSMADALLGVPTMPFSKVDAAAVLAATMGRLNAEVPHLPITHTHTHTARTLHTCTSLLRLPPPLRSGPFVLIRYSACAANRTGGADTAAQTAQGPHGAQGPAARRGPGGCADTYAACGRGRPCEVCVDHARTPR